MKLAFSVTNSSQPQRPQSLILPCGRSQVQDLLHTLGKLGGHGPCGHKLPLGDWEHGRAAECGDVFWSDSHVSGGCFFLNDTLVIKFSAWNWTWFRSVSWSCGCRISWHLCCALPWWKMSGKPWTDSTWRMDQMVGRDFRYRQDIRYGWYGYL